MFCPQKGKLISICTCVLKVEHTKIQWKTDLPTINEINSIFIVIGEFHIWIVTLIIVVHDSRSVQRMLQPQEMSNFMESNRKKVNSIVCTIGECFIVIKVHNSRLREKCMRKVLSSIVEGKRARAVAFGEKPWITDYRIRHESAGRVGGGGGTGFREGGLRYKPSQGVIISPFFYLNGVSKYPPYPLLICPWNVYRWRCNLPPLTIEAHLVPTDLKI